MVDNELNSDEYSSKISRDRSLACVLASRMLASYVPLTSGGPTRATVAAGIAHVMQAAVCSTENVSLNMASTFKASDRSGLRQNKSVHARVWDPLCA